MRRIVVIGGGAAGMMAAIAAADGGCRVTLIEKNEKLGKKLFITGKGRCNVTNAADMETLFASVCSNRKFLYSAFYDFDNRSVMDLLEHAGCPLKVERGERVFPVSDHSSDIIGALRRELNRREVEILLDTAVRELIFSEHSVTGVVLDHGKRLMCDSVIVCTGGISYPSTGSTGDGYRFAEYCGHKVVTPTPSLVPLETKEDWCRELMGLSLKNVSLTMTLSKRKVYEGFGEMLFTHFGVSGPLVLSASTFYREGADCRLAIDLKPALSEEQLDKRLLREFDANHKKQFKNALSELFPNRLIPVMIELSGISPEKKVHEITKAERANFVKIIKHLELTVTGTRGFAEAIITRGGISVKDVNPSTMESRKVKGLYFAGEVLDLDAMTGGYNLQIAWSTGHLAGESAARSDREERTMI